MPHACHVTLSLVHLSTGKRAKPRFLLQSKDKIAVKQVAPEAISAVAKIFGCLKERQCKVVDLFNIIDNDKSGVIEPRCVSLLCSV